MNDPKSSLGKTGIFSLILILTLFLSSCETVQPVADVATAVGVLSGKIDSQEAEKISQTVGIFSNSFEDFTPEQEYYIGRSVAANILRTYKPYENEKLRNYLNLIGKSCSLASTRPETFGGYHFLVVASDEINAFAVPGGLIFISKGLVKCCRSEDELAAVVAHEIAHVQYKHGLQAIRQDRITQVLGMVAEEALKDRKADNQQLAELFDGSIGDITTTLIANGYSQNQEFRADQGALYILAALGYDPGALTRVLQTMKQRLKPNTADFYRTHPSPDSRIREISKVYQAHGSIPVNSARQKRFLDATEGVD